jgi:hypothetical protein
MMNQTQFHDLRTELVDALYQAGGCQTDFCTSQICCAPMAKLMDRVGLAYNPRPGSYWSNYVHAQSTPASFEEEMVLEVIGMLVRSGRICERNIWEGFSEIPMSIGELLSKKDGYWRQQLRDLEHEQMSNAQRVMIAKDFLYELTKLALSDKYFEFLRQKNL